MARGGHLLLFTLAAMAVVGILILFIFLPSFTAAGGGGTGGFQKYCSETVTLQGTYNSVLLIWLSNVQISTQEGSCTIIPIPGLSGLNILPTSFPATMTLVSGTNTIATNQLSVSVPAFQATYPFSTSTTFGNLIPGVYTVTFSSQIPIGNGFSSVYSQSATFTVS